MKLKDSQRLEEFGVYRKKSLLHAGGRSQLYTKTTLLGKYLPLLLQRTRVNFFVICIEQPQKFASLLYKRRIRDLNYQYKMSSNRKCTFSKYDQGYSCFSLDEALAIIFSMWVVIANLLHKVTPRNFALAESKIDPWVQSLFYRFVCTWTVRRVDFSTPDVAPSLNCEQKFLGVGMICFRTGRNIPFSCTVDEMIKFCIVDRDVIKTEIEQERSLRARPLNKYRRSNQFLR